jgi:hypothetical protein
MGILSEIQRQVGGSRAFDGCSRQSAGKGSAGKGLAIKSSTPSARLLRKVMKAAAGTSRLDELRTARIHHAPARVEGIVRRGGQIFNFRTLSDGKSWSGRSLQTRVVERGGVAD